MKAPTPISAAPTLRTRSLMSVGKKQTIITGGAGCLGRHLIAALNARDEDNIVVVDRLGSGDRWKNLVGLRFDDLVDRDDFRARVRDNGLPSTVTVIHLGEETIGEPDTLTDLNYRFSRELGEACFKSGARCIYASSAATYGSGELGCFDNEAMLPNLRPVDAYGFSKHLFDLWAQRSGALAKFAGLKFFHVYGPQEAQGDGASSLVSDVLRQIRATGEAVLRRTAGTDDGDAGPQNDFVHVRDAVAMLLFFYDRPEAAGLFNCGSGRARTAGDVAKAVFAALGQESSIRFVEPSPEVAPPLSFGQADMTKARTAGFDHEFLALEAGVQSCVADSVPVHV